MTSALNLGPYGSSAKLEGPQFPDPFAISESLLGGIKSALPSLEDLSRQINEFQQGQITGQVEDLFPGLKEAINKAGKNVSSELAGMVPEDVINSFQRATAARGVDLGIPGSEYIGKDFAEKLGLTGLDLSRLGLSDLGALTTGIRSSLTAQPFDISQNIPTMTDIYNQKSSQAVADAQTAQRNQDIAIYQASLARTDPNYGYNNVNWPGTALPGHAIGGGSTAPAPVTVPSFYPAAAPSYTYGPMSSGAPVVQSFTSSPSPVPAATPAAAPAPVPTAYSMGVGQPGSVFGLNSPPGSTGLPPSSSSSTSSGSAPDASGGYSWINDLLSSIGGGFNLASIGL